MPALPKYRAGPDTVVAREILIRPYQPGDEASIMDGFNETFGLDRSTDYWRWKFRPDENGEYILVAVDEGNGVLAAFGCLTAIVRVNGVRLRVAQGADVYCRRRPDLIRKRVFMKLMSEWIERYLRRGPFALLQGFAGPTPMRVYEQVVGPFRPRQIEFYSRAVPSEAVRFGSMFEFRPLADGSVLDILWPEVERRYPCAMIRAAHWADWRFLKSPVRTFSAHGVFAGDGRPVAWFVVAAEGGTYHLCDLLFDGRPAVIDAIERFVMSDAQAQGAIRAEILLHNDHVARDVLELRGWRGFRHPHGATWCMHGFVEGLDRDGVIDGIYLTHADTDFV